MLNASSFRLAQEFDLLAKIRVHPALPITEARMSEFWATPQEKRRTRDDALQNDDQALKGDMYPEAQAAVAQGLALFGAEKEFSMVATGTETSSHQEVVFRADGEHLRVELPRAILFRLPGPQLAAAVGHGLGHFLLDHHVDRDLAALLSLVRLAVVPDQGRAEELWDDPACADLLMDAAALFQFQDFSADRISLLVAQDVTAVVQAIARSFLDVKATPQHSLRKDAHCLVPSSLACERTHRPHPSFVDRVVLLESFAASAAYRKTIGLAGGLNADELAQSTAARLPGRDPCPGPWPDDLDEVLLELILMDWLLAAGRRPRPQAEAIMLRFLPPGTYDRLIERYDELSDDDDDDASLLPWLQRAALRSPWWKIAMIERFLYLDSLDSRLDDQALGEVASLSAAMGAREECRRIYTLGFGFDPFRWSTSPLETLLREQIA